MLEVKLLGGFQVTSGGEPIAAVNTPRLQSLLAYLCLRRGVPQSRQTLAFMLWPESTETQARTNLRTLLHRLRAALPQADSVLSLDTQAVLWRPGPAYRLDVDEFESALHSAGQASAAAPAQAELERAAELYQGQLFPECYDDWVLPERERLHQMALGALERLVDLLERDGNVAAALERARRLLLLDPLRESTSLSLMRLHLLQGQRAAALRVYHQHAATLRDELAVEPGPAMLAAYAQLTAADPAASFASEPLSAGFPIIGREAEQARMRSMWQTAAQGRPYLLAVEGEAGLGKTRLAEDLLAWAERQGAAAAVARCYAAEGDLAYAPVTAWLRSDAIRPRLTRLEDVWLVEVARLLPEVLSSRPHLASPGPLTEGWQRQRLLESLARAVLAGQRPLLLLIDDLQWCDADTLEWLHFLLRYSSRARLMLLATLRPEEAAPQPALAALLDDLRRGSQLTEISLKPLSAQQTAALAGHMSGRPLAAAEAAGLYAETEGNPLFVVETLRAGWLDASGQAGAGPNLSPAAPLPPGVRSVIAHRLGQLTPQARDLLGVAAVIGRSFAVRVLERAASIDEPDLVRSLDELWQRRLVREQGADAYDFSHDKVRAAAYAGLSPARRRLLHRRVAEALVNDPLTDLAAVSGQLAAHYEQAGQAGLAADYYGQAAEAAARVFANADAIASLRRALALLSPTPAGGGQHAQAAAFSERLGGLLHLTGQYAEAREAFQHSRKLIAAPGNLSSPALAQLQRQIGNTWRDQYHYPEAQAAYAAAEAELRPAPDSVDTPLWQEWLQIQLERLLTHYWLAETSEMFALLDRLQPILEQYGTPLHRARTSQISAFALIRRDRGGSPAAVQAMAAYLASVQAAGASSALPAARFNLGFAMLLNGDLDQAEPELLAALSTAEQTGDVSLQARCLTYLAVASRKRQQLEAVRAYTERAVQAATAGHMPDYLGAAAANRAWLAWRAGDRAQALVLGQQALDEWARTPIAFSSQWLAHWPLLAASLAGQQLSAAVEHARAMLDPKQNRLPEPLDTALAQAVRAADSGDQAAARAALLEAHVPAAELGFL